MCQACCDLTKVEKSESGNCFWIPTQGSQSYTTKRDALVIPISAGHYSGSRISVVPNSSAIKDDTECRYSRQGSASAFIPGRGEWRIYNDGLAPIKVVVLETYCGAAFQAFARTGYEKPVHSTIAMSAVPASTLVIAANRSRSYLLIQAPTANTVKAFLAFGPDATANAGIELSPGDSYEMSGDNLWRGVINGILPSATASQTLLVTEGV